MKITDLVSEMARPVVEELGLELWDVEYVREGGDFYLRVYIDRPDGVDITDCEAVSRRLDPMLDEADPIQESYHFEVCSAGLERVLKRPGDFERFMGSPVLVKLYRPKNGAKEFSGDLEAYADGNVTLKTPAGMVDFEKTEIAQVRLRVEF